MTAPKSHRIENPATAANPLGAAPLHLLSVPEAALCFERGVSVLQCEAAA
jgi:hypothetical protein